VRPVSIGAKSRLTLPESFLLLADEVIEWMAECPANWCCGRLLHRHV